MIRMLWRNLCLQNIPVKNLMSKGTMGIIKSLNFLNGNFLVMSMPDLTLDMLGWVVVALERLQKLITP